MLVAGTFFTKGWCYSIDSWLEHFCSAVQNSTGILIASTDQSDECMEKYRKISERLAHTKWASVHVASGFDTDRHECYKDDAQLIIAKIQQKAFAKARELGADMFWSIESDVLVPPNALNVLKQALEFDDGYYGIGMITYPNGQFLGGRGTPRNHICEDATEDERELPEDLKKKIEKRKKEMEKLSESKKPPTKEQEQEWAKIQDEIKKCPPKGNIFELQSKGWKKRGWMESAYPAIGRGAILPTDWVGLGCTMLNKKALSLATFEGYELKGTQDLFLCWNRWHPAGIKMCVIPHVLCHHVKRKVGKDEKRTDEIEVHEAYHELDGEYEGHLRWRPRKYINFNE
ncbi:MAG: hypothetical protein EBR82_21965 [Caulobacteraceae bacterium]|nr:hypothetical protein [Caulobacteraceae bacterium]